MAGWGPAPSPAIPDPTAVEQCLQICTQETPARAAKALEISKGDVSEAVNWLFANPAPPEATIISVADNADTELQRAIEASKQLHETEQRVQRDKSADANLAVVGDQDANMQAALLRSMADAKTMGIQADTDVLQNPTELTREDGIPCGLKNVGNTCYFNTFLQLFFSLPDFREAVYQWSVVEDESALKQEAPASRSGPALFLLALQRCFASMQHSVKKWIDPSAVLAGLRDSERKPGEQEDCAEFNDRFVALTEEAFELPKDPQQPDGPKAGDSTLVRKAFEGVRHESYSSPGGLQNSKTDVFRGVVLAVGSWCKTLHDLLELHTSEEEIEYTWEEASAEADTRALSQKQVWFQDLPEILTFQLQRVLFDRERQETTKNRQRIQYPLRLILDRYHTSSAETTRKVRKEVVKLREKLDQAEKRLSDLHNHDGSGMSLCEMLRKVSAAFPERGRAHGPDTLPEQLDTWADAEARDIAEQKALVESLAQQIDTAYGEEEGKLRYRLQGVMTHDGVAAYSGHYWACVWHEEQRCWFKYNDRQVTPVDEADVLSTGGAGPEGAATASAYCLVYVREGADGAPAVPRPPAALLEEVEKDNEDHRGRVAQWRANERRVIEALDALKTQVMQAQECSFDYDSVTPHALRDPRTDSLAAFASCCVLRGGAECPEEVMQTLYAVDAYARCYPGRRLLSDLQTKDKEDREQAEKAAKDCQVLVFALEHQQRVQDMGTMHEFFVTTQVHYKSLLEGARAVRSQSAHVWAPDLRQRQRSQLATIALLATAQQVVDQSCRQSQKLLNASAIFALRFALGLADWLRAPHPKNVASILVAVIEPLNQLFGVISSALPAGSLGNLMERVRRRACDTVSDALESPAFQSKEVILSMELSGLVRQDGLRGSTPLREWLRRRVEIGAARASTNRDLGKPPPLPPPREYGQLADDVVSLEAELFHGSAEDPPGHEAAEFVRRLFDPRGGDAVMTPVTPVTPVCPASGKGVSETMDVDR
eukprot:TRINITY_DN8619_c0_g1_i1.p1 TRINITY_DN8619_c0_g1~~TRINITY_DN8619_c0_g1_i1.p1  ORF type:complete len:1034 (+),score=335.03 TRINITY_DN8619_c0_g1_i1:110-3103(+)